MEYLIANWKANNSLEFAKNWFSLWSKNATLSNLTTVVCPPFSLLSFVSSRPLIICGAQDLPSTESLKLIKYCIVGHSDKRNLGETLETIKSKMENLIGASITPIMCFEDTRDLEFVKPYIGRAILAYEPSKNISQNGEFKELNFEDLKNIAQKIKNIYGNSISLLYGGSVNIENVLQIKNLNVFNGVLVGKASLDPLEFYQLGKIWVQ